MKSLRVALSGRSYDILISSGLLNRCGAYCRQVLPRAKRLAVVTDETVAALYLAPLLEDLRKSGFMAEAVILPPGESTKSLAMLGTLYDAFMDIGLTRTDAVVALGGGVIGDLAGFAAATILRGVDFVQIPTTLLAQVDSSVGGKVAIDLPAGKNLAGAFWQPKLVLMDPDVLSTLTLPVFMAGMAEVVKYGCIFNRDFFTFLGERPHRAQLMADIESILYTCCNLKRGVVETDELDTGERMLLNFGHTLGHAYELAGHYLAWSHGQAVAAGMCLAARLGERLGVTPPGVTAQVSSLCATLGLPTSIACTQAEYAAAVGLDKKGSGDDITLILLEDIGRAVLKKLPKAQVLQLLEGQNP